jgi:hypothetical protein
MNEDTNMTEIPYSRTKQYRREQYLKNKDEIKRSSKAYYQRNKRKIRATQKEYNKRIRNIVKAYEANQKATL